VQQQKLKRAKAMSNVQLNTPYQALSLIKAGAGAGKTYHIQKTLTEWIEQGKVSANRILAVTFTNAAANEMKERIRLALIEQGLMSHAKNLSNATISTIHGFGTELIHKYAFEQGLSPKPKQLSEVEQKVLISFALSEVEAIVPLMNNLQNFGYELKQSKGDWVDPAEVLRGDVLAVIKLLRNLSTNVDLTRTEKILKQAKEAITAVYHCSPSSAESLNNALWQAIAAVRNKFTQEELNNEWGTNKATRDFVKAIYKTTEEKLKNDWAVWIALQTIETAPRIFNKRTGHIVHDDGQLAIDIWQAADKLSVHPGPLEQQVTKVDALLNTAIDALENYQQHKKQTGWIDFGDMVSLAQSLMQNKAWQEEMKSCYDCLIIDEFQDTNPLQFSLLWGFKKAGIPTLIVGDVKQSVMGFQGADSRLFNQLCQQYSAQTAELGGNWRSTEQVMEFVNKLGSNLFGDEYQALTPMSGLTSELEPVSILNFSKEQFLEKPNAKSSKYVYNQEGYLALAQELKALVDSKKQITDKVTHQKRDIQYSDVAVLGRTHKELQNFSGALSQLSIQSKLTEQGWYESAAISTLIHAISYVADPRDNLTALNIKLMLSPQSSLENVLKEFVSQPQPRKFESGELTQLNELRKATRFLSVTNTIEKIIETLSLWHRPIALDFDIEQRRANLLKLLGKAKDFEQAEAEVVTLQGIYGKSLSSFLVWLKTNKDEFNELPRIQSINESSVELSTWHASKGLEWPVVMVLSLEKPQEVWFDHFSLQYGEINGIEDMLSEAFPQVIGEFKDKNVKERFVTELQPGEQQTLRNLVYVAMTRAREQLILPCFDTQKDNSALLLLNQLDLSQYPAKQIYTAETSVSTLQQEKLFATSKKRAFAFEQREFETTVSSQISPSELSLPQTQITVLTEQEVIELHYQSPLDLSPLDKVDADVLGTLIHQCYQVLLANDALAPRLFDANKAIAEQPEMQSAITTHIATFKSWAQQHWQATGFNTEVPFISQKGDQVVNGIVDLLIETPEGYYIVDHKTDRLTSIDRFNHHLPQLQAYQQCLSLDRPILGIAINWVREGKLLHYSEAGIK
jgi:ATP-dependent helicase/nuclease subunit A